MANDKIQVIMLMDVKNIGRKNEILNVAPAYAKNVLKNVIDKVAADQRKKQATHDTLATQVEQMVQSLKESGLSIEGKVSPAGKLYAKIDIKTIAQELTKKFGFTIDSTRLKSDKMDHAGEYEIKITFEKIKSSFTLTIIGTK